MRSDAAAIILGAGQGLRFGAGLPAGRAHVRKQYMRLHGRPLLWWSLAAFNACASMHTLILVAPTEDLPRLSKLLTRWNFIKVKALVAGGKERSDSVKEGLKALPASCRWVAVHDGVRPLVTPAQIETVLQAARRYRAAIAAVPSRDTVKIADAKEFIQASPERRRVWQAQTPQIFSRELLERAHQAKHPVTDDAQLVEKLGVHVKLVDTSAENIKVTLPLDLKLAALILKSRRSA